MSEYRHTIYKTDLTSPSTDPPQDLNVSGEVGTDAGITRQNAVGIGVAAIYGKKIANASYHAVVDQIGNQRLDRAISIGTKVAGYIGIAIASGPSAPLIIGGALAVEGATWAINNTVESHSLNLQNQRLEFDRGTRLKLGAGGYYG